MTHFEKINTDAASKVSKLLKRLTFGCKYRIIRYEVGDLATDIYNQFNGLKRSKKVGTLHFKPYKDPRKSDPSNFSDLVRDLYELGDLLENYDERLEKYTIQALYCANALPIMRVIVREYERDPLANR